jgi:hypothetical protein
VEDDVIPQRIAQVLAQAWSFHQTPGFADYAKRTFGCDIQQLVKCDGIYLAEAEVGDATTGSIGGLVKQWWLVDDRGTTPISCAKLPSHRDAPENLRSQFYIFPVIKFLRQADAIVIGEAFGPEMHCRKVGQVVFANGTVTIAHVRVIWSSNSI